jgi:hypothetical protein
MPTLFILFGMRFHFYSKEHLPAHIHVVKGDATAKFVIEPTIVLIENKGFKPQELKLAESVIEENRELIVMNWKRYFKTT